MRKIILSLVFLLLVIQIVAAEEQMMDAVVQGADLSSLVKRVEMMSISGRSELDILNSLTIKGVLNESVPKREVLTEEGNPLTIFVFDLGENEEQSFNEIIDYYNTEGYKKISEKTKGNVRGIELYNGEIRMLLVRKDNRLIEYKIEEVMTSAGAGSLGNWGLWVWLIIGVMIAALCYFGYRYREKILPKLKGVIGEKGIDSLRKGLTKGKEFAEKEVKFAKEGIKNVKNKSVARGLEKTVKKKMGFVKSDKASIIINFLTAVLMFILLVYSFGYIKSFSRLILPSGLLASVLLLVFCGYSFIKKKREVFCMITDFSVGMVLVMMGMNAFVFGGLKQILTPFGLCLILGIGLMLSANRLSKSNLKTNKKETMINLFSGIFIFGFLFITYVFLQGIFQSYSPFLRLLSLLCGFAVLVCAYLLTRDKNKRVCMITDAIVAVFFFYMGFINFRYRGMYGYGLIFFICGISLAYSAYSLWKKK